MMTNMILQPNEPNESLGIILREKESLYHTKGGRDAVIKLWHNKEEDNIIELVNNFEHHIDWVNDLAISINNKDKPLLFSCSNDRTINIWSLNCNTNNNSSTNITITETYPIHNFHTDYIKCLNYNSYTNKLFAAGFDGLVTCFDIEDYQKSLVINNCEENYLHMTNQKESIYCMDSEPSGKIILGGSYENNIFAFDCRQKRELFHLRGHKDLVRALRISPDGRIIVSASSDKTLKVWDMRTHKILKSWEFHTDSLHSLYVNPNFTKIISGSRNGEVYLTDLPSGCFCKITQVDEIVTSISINTKNDILFATSKGEIHEIQLTKTKPKHKNELIKNSFVKPKDKNHPETTKINSISNSLNGINLNNSNYPKNKNIAKVFFSEKNIPSQNISHNNLSHNLSKNENFVHYLINTNPGNEIQKYHLMKNKIYLICESKNKISIYNIMKLTKIKEFNIDGGSNSLTFEKLLEIVSKYDTISLKKWISIDIKLGVPSITFTKENMQINPSDFDVDYLEKIIEQSNSFTKNIYPGEFRKDNESLLNMTQLSNHSSQTYNKSFNKTSEIDKMTSLSNTMPPVKKNLLIKNTCGQVLIKSIFLRWINKKTEIYKPFFNSNFWDTRGYIKNSLLNFDEEKIKLNLDYNFFLYFTNDSLITVSPNLDEVGERSQLPNFVKEFIKIPHFNLDPPPILKKDKIEVIIDNRKKDLKNKNDNNDTDELEAYGYITVESFKNWLIKCYIDFEHLKSIVKNDLNSLSEKKYVKDPKITILQLREYFFPNSTLTIGLRYACIATLIDRKIIKFV